MKPDPATNDLGNESGRPTEHARTFDQIDASFDASVEEIRRFLRQPGFSHTGIGIRETAGMALEYLRMVGSSEAELVETDGNPVVFGHLRSMRRDAKTLIVYSLYDEVPVVSEDWTYPPMEARIVDAGSINAPAHLGKVICARAAVNQRGPMLAAVLAFKAMKDATGDIPVNVIWVWEGEEEIGCPHLLQFVRKKFAELDRADAFWMPSMTQDTEGVMRVDRGSKGTVKIEIRIKGGEWGGTRSGKDLWSANLPLVDAPMWRMVRALDSMVDNGDRLIVDGIQDLVRPRDAEEIEELAVLKDHLDEQELMDSLGIARFKRGQPAAELYEDFLMAPMVNVVGIVGGYTGPKVFTTLPMDVVAKLDFRLTPNVLADNVPRLLRAHLDRRGFNEVEIEVLGGYDYSRTPASDPIYQAAFEAARRHACPYRVYPTTPAVAPFGMFNLRPLAKPAVFVGMGHGARAHAADEYITVEGIRDFMKYAVTFLHVWAAL